MLLLHVSRPVRLSDTSAGSSDLRSISYFVAQSGAGGLAGAVADRQQAELGVNPDPKTTKVGGLVRLEGDRMDIDSEDSTGDLATLAADAEFIAPEIAAVQFRYFDGQSWQDTWDSPTLGRLPQAVEMIAQMATAPASTSPLAAKQVDQTPRYHRFVFALPQHLATGLPAQQ